MAADMVISCPECHKQFKGRPDLQGKRVRCSGCGQTFLVKSPAPDKAASGPGAGGAPARPKGKGGPADDEWEDPNPYGVTTLDIRARCPHCANLMQSEDAVICLHCGYNTQTRQLGSTRKLVQHSGGDYFFHLLPGLLCVLGILFLINWDIFLCTYLPGMIKDSWAEFLDAESMRLWNAVISLFLMWGLGMFAFKRLILEPAPPEKLKD
jgi:hypothetical protein